MISFTVIACNEDHGLLEIDALKEDTIKFINSIKAVKNNSGLLRGYMARISLKEKHYQSYVKSKE